MIRIQTERFEAAELAKQLQDRAGSRAGALVHFLGMVRDYSPDAGSHSLFLEHYPGMCEREIQALCDHAKQRWDVLDTLVVHRVGELPLGDPIVFVGVAATHRGQAFQACEYIIDALKTRAPFWKRETLADGRAFWVEQRAADAAKTAQWDHPQETP
ncbi:MAG: molybdenum cofactor biosynthesis protein MoaE [Castellaniella sp.]|uniref:molybdenum cofactor biosynthesis protein MoaE n=1 Tax=Castellaniella sp. TaxID=1955812 RepID=UPI002A35A6DF|nr:molybdenum cofactor biosynthesis protein MoaE [Castellaniella sp.]MDY0309880.1 molybdenum cofactor biosynthesis protein MoaE [Castellaniella sp.]